MKIIKVEWCENFIRAAFTKHHPFAGRNPGIEVGRFWKMAEKSGLWERGTYGSPMSKAVGNLCYFETVFDMDGNFAYDVFRLKKADAALRDFEAQEF